MMRDSLIAWMLLLAVSPLALEAESYVIANGQRIAAPSGCSIVSSAYGTAVAPSGCSIVSSAYGTAVAPSGSSVVSSANGTTIAPAGSSIISSSSGTVVTSAWPRAASHSAIAYSQATRRCGSSWNWGTEALAEKKAIESCNQPDCQVVVKAQSMCAALAASSYDFHVYQWARDYDRSRTRKTAMDICEKRKAPCEIVCDTCNH